MITDLYLWALLPSSVKWGWLQGHPPLRGVRASSLKNLLERGISLVIQQLRLSEIYLSIYLSAIPGQETRSHMTQLRIESHSQRFCMPQRKAKASVLRKSVPRQVDKKSRGPPGERGLGFSRRKGQPFFPSTFLSLSHVTKPGTDDSFFPGFFL